MDRLLAAVEDSIAERGVATLTVQDVARRAGLAAGTLYTRFAGKDALLRAFTIAFFARARRTADTLFEDQRWRALPARNLVTALVRVLVKSYRAKRGLLRALHLYVRSHPDSEFQRQAAAFNSDLVGRLTALLLLRREAIRNPAPERAALLGFLIVDAAAKESILFSDARPPDLAVSDDELIDVLANVYCRQLDLE
jgi:AcrR family transcriptional regulator